MPNQAAQSALAAVSFTSAFEDDTRALLTHGLGWPLRRAGGEHQERWARHPPLPCGIVKRAVPLWGPASPLSPDTCSAFLHHKADDNLGDALFVQKSPGRWRFLLVRDGPSEVRSCLVHSLSSSQLLLGLLASVSRSRRGGFG